MAARKAPAAKAAAKPAAKTAPAAKETPAPEPVKADGGLSYQAALAGVSSVNQSWQTLCLSIAFLYFHKCISAAERAALECFVVARYTILPEKVEAEVTRREADFIKYTEQHRAEVEKAKQEAAN